MFKYLSSVSLPLLIGTCIFGMLTTATPISKTNSTAAGPAKRQAGVESCHFQYSLFFRSYYIAINNDDQYDTNGCGRGFLDNFRGRCGDITGWTCTYTEGNDIFMAFETSLFCQDYDITAAINAASYGNLNTPCHESPL